MSSHPPCLMLLSCRGGTTAQAEGTNNMKLMHRAVAAATIITGVAVMGVTGTAMAAGECGARSTTAAFARWGDSNQYFVADGGTFELGSTPWVTWGSARTTPNQSPFAMTGLGHTRSMRLPAYSGAGTPPICVFHNEESVRFSYKAPYVGATLEVYIEVSNEQGYADTDTYVTATTRMWDVSQVIDVPNLRDSNGQQWITIWIQPVDGVGTWQVDDVMIDPWIAR